MRAWSQVLPTLAGVVSSPQAQSSSMVEGCLNMLCLLVSPQKRSASASAIPGVGVRVCVCVCVCV